MENTSAQTRVHLWTGWHQLMMLVKKQTALIPENRVALPRAYLEVLKRENHKG